MTTVDIAEMPVAEKLKPIDALGDSLSAQADRGLESPTWHGAELEERLRRLSSGEETASPWKEAKDRIRARAQVKAG